MIRVLHLADLHLGVESYGRIDPATGLSSRLTDFLAALDEVVEYALASKVDLFLFCGDAYKSRDPSQTHQREFARRIGRLAANGIPVFLVVGNHDLPNAIGRATAVEIFDTLSIKNVFVANEAGTHRIETPNGSVQVVALPWVRRSALLSHEEHKNLTYEQLNKSIEERLTNWLSSAAQALDPGLPSLLAAHVSLSSATPGSEKSMMIGRDHVLLRSAAANPAFDYVALGHIHRQQVLSERPPVVYAGSLQAIDFSEEGEEKGFYVIQIGDGVSPAERATSYEFHPLRTRRFLTIQVNTKTEDPTSEVLRAIARKDVADAIVRLQIKVSAPNEGLIRDSEIQKALEDAYYVAAITKEVEREHRSRLGGHAAEQLTPIEALKLYLDSRKTPPEQTRVLLEYGQRLIQRETSLE